MKHYRAKPSAQLSKCLKDDMKRAVMKLETSTQAQTGVTTRNQFAIAQCADYYAHHVPMS